MDYISSKNICVLTRDMLKLIDSRLVNHGLRVAYLIYKMLECKGGYEKFEIAEAAFLATIHDIGACKTDSTEDMLNFEFKDFVPHSIYGYLFLKHLSPYEDKAKVLLYHHIDWVQVESIDYSDKNLSAYINLAEKIVIYSSTLGDKFNYTVFEKYRNTKFSPEALDLFYQAVKVHSVFDKLNSGEYLKEMEELFSYLLFTNEEKVKYMEMLMYFIGFRGEGSVVDTVTCMCICEEMGIRYGLNTQDMEILYYGALLHDIGMLAIPKEIIGVKRKLTQEEHKIMRTHVEIGNEIIHNIWQKEIVEVAISHHERADGSGYPRGLREFEMNRLQKILQLADTVCGLTNSRIFRDPKNKKEVITILKDEVLKHKFGKDLVESFINDYDQIMEQVLQRSNEIQLTYSKLNNQYQTVLKNFMK